MQRWQAPEFTEIDMNAEIGAYQRDPAQEPDPLRPPLPGQPLAPEARAQTQADTPSQRG